MSIFNILISYLSKEGREFRTNLSNLMRMYKDVRAPLLAGVLYTTKSIEDGIAVISNCMSNVRKQRRQGGGGHHSQRKNAISVYKIIENFLSEEGEQFKTNLETLIRTYSEIRAPLLAGILYTKRTIKEAMRVIAKTLSIMPKPKKHSRKMMRGEDNDADHTDADEKNQKKTQVKEQDTESSEESYKEEEKLEENKNIEEEQEELSMFESDLEDRKENPPAKKKSRIFYNRKQMITQSNEKEEED